VRVWDWRVQKEPKLLFVELDKPIHEVLEDRQLVHFETQVPDGRYGGLKDDDVAENEVVMNEDAPEEGDIGQSKGLVGCITSVTRAS